MLENRFMLADERNETHKDPNFPSCAHCTHYLKGCKKLKSKLKNKVGSWSSRDYTKCETFLPIKSTTQESNPTN